jgi:SMODS-associating 2TM, beta-strand rich effector domain
MSLHEYSIIGHQRASIGRWIGVASIVISPVIAGLLQQVAYFSFVPVGIAGMSISAGLIYLGLYWTFNKYGWRWLDKLLKIPCIDGVWDVDGATLDEAGNTKYSWKAKLTITQDWDKISVSIKTEQSGSDSETASVLMRPNGEVKLSYSYQNHPRIGEVELQKHQGFCELTFDPEINTASGRYFNSSGRLTFGRMNLKKEGKT